MRTESALPRFVFSFKIAHRFMYLSLADLFLFKFFLYFIQNAFKTMSFGFCVIMVISNDFVWIHVAGFGTRWCRGPVGLRSPNCWCTSWVLYFAHQTASVSINMAIWIFGS